MISFSLVPNIRLIVFPAALYLILSLACTQIPLLNYLGYEFSFAIGFLGSLVAGMVTIGVLRAEIQRPDDSLPQRMRGAFRNVLLWNGLLLLIPLLVMVSNSLFVPNCSLTEGFLFFLALPVVSIWFASCLAFFCAVHYCHPRTLFVLFFGATLLYTAALGYFTPAIFSYNFFYGYFPGLTYDELLEITLPIVLFRLLTVLVGFILLRMGLLILEQGPVTRNTTTKGVALVRGLFHPEHLLATTIAIVLLVSVYLFREPLGFESGEKFIQQELGSSIETDHFIIYYSDSVYSEEEIHWIAATHEFRLKQILTTFHLSTQERLESYIYPTVEAKRRYIGTGTTSITKPWSGEMHIHATALDDVLKHELVHLVASRFGIPIIRTSVNPGLTEGLAMSVEWQWGNRTLHEYSASMKKFIGIPDMNSIMGSVGFAGQASSVSYVLAGSFCRFLMDEFGVRSMTRLYSSGDYQGIYGRPVTALLEEWETMLGAVQLDEGAADAADVFFRAPPIFQKTCPRVTARRLASARKELLLRNYASSSELYRASYHEGRGRAALTGYLYSELRRGHTAPLISALDTIMQQNIPAMSLPLFLPIGDAFWLEGEPERAAELYWRVTCADFNDRYTEAAIIRSRALEDTVWGERLRTYLMSDRHDSLRIGYLDSVLEENPSHGLALLLRGRLHFRLARWNECIADLTRLDFGETEKRLEAERRKLLGRCYVRIGQLQEARAMFWTSLNEHSTPASMDLVNDWIERCEWMEESETRRQSG